MSSLSVRPAAVAGMFYPDSPQELSQMVGGFLLEARNEKGKQKTPKVLVVPHAGYVYSGQAAARAYGMLESVRHQIKKVVLLGPCHRVPVRGVALPAHEAFETPLGHIPVDTDSAERIRNFPFVSVSGEAHQLEHSLEVHLPFLQTVLDDFQLLPLVVGDVRPADIARLLEEVWGGDETLIIISTDLSHFLPYDVAREVDRNTVDKILQLDDSLHGEEACGCRPLNGLLHHARQKNMHCQLLALCNSGDTAGDKDRVVGYASFMLN